VRCGIGFEQNLAEQRQPRSVNGARFADFADRPDLPQDERRSRIGDAALREEVRRVEGDRAVLSRVHAQIGIEMVGCGERRQHDGRVSLSPCAPDRLVRRLREHARVTRNREAHPASGAQAFEHALHHGRVGVAARPILIV